MSLLEAQKRRVASLLKGERDRQGWNQKEFAGVLKVSPAALCGWETGRSLPSLEWQERLADYFDMTPREVLFGDDDHGPEAA